MVQLSLWHKAEEAPLSLLPPYRASKTQALPGGGAQRMELPGGPWRILPGDVLSWAPMVILKLLNFG